MRSRRKTQRSRREGVGKTAHVGDVARRRWGVRGWLGRVGEFVDCVMRVLVRAGVVACVAAVRRFVAELIACDEVCVGELVCVVGVRYMAADTVMAAPVCGRGCSPGAR